MKSRWDVLTTCVAAGLTCGVLTIGTAMAQTPPGASSGAPAEDRQIAVEEKAPPAASDGKAEKPAGPGAPPDAGQGKGQDAAGKGAPPVEPDDTKGEPKTAKPKNQQLDLPEEKVVDVPAPGDAPLEKSAYAALDKHCARCHQNGKLNRIKPAKNFGNILKLDEIARDPDLVQPGNPDASGIYVQMVKREMPYDVFQEYSGGDEPSAEELEAVRRWIESLGEAVEATCKDRKFIGYEALLAAIGQDIGSEKSHRLKGMRYVTLDNLYNSCVSDEELGVYRQAVVKLLNSLSQNSDPLRLETVDEAGTIIKFHLDDLNWTESDWDTILAAYPYAVKPDHPSYEYVKATTGTKLAWVRGDWLAYTASRPPLYEKLLKLPDTFKELQAQLKVDVDANIASYRAKRAGFQKSLVSRNNRLIERHTTPTGVFWTSYDFAGNRDNQSLFEHPTGPDGDAAFEHDGGESVLSLPNGFNAYYLNTKDGKKLTSGPTEIVQDQTQRDLKVTNGISCFGCHNQGFRKATDEIRAHVVGNKSFPKKVRDDVEALYPPVEEMNKLLEEDVDRFRTAMRRADLDPDVDLNGVEIINALSQKFESNVDLKLAAAEYGMEEEEFQEAMTAASDGAAFRMKRRLEQGTVPRDSFEGKFAGLVGKVSDAEHLDLSGGVKGKTGVAKVKGKTSTSDHDFELSLFSDKSAYKVNDRPVFTVKAKEKCHLTLINVDSNGKGTVLFPNKFQKNNFLKADKEFKFPADDAKFQFRMKDKGTETVIAVCNATGKTADGIKHNFKTRAFSPLGDYRSFLTRQIVVEAAKETKAGKTPATKSTGKKTTGKKATAKTTKKKTVVARTAIKFKVQ